MSGEIHLQSIDSHRDSVARCQKILERYAGRAHHVSGRHTCQYEAKTRRLERHAMYDIYSLDRETGKRGCLQRAPKDFCKC